MTDETSSGVKKILHYRYLLCNSYHISFWPQLFRFLDGEASYWDCDPDNDSDC